MSVSGKKLGACHECDLLFHYEPIEVGTTACCPQCGYILYRNKTRSLNRTLAWTIAGLILFIPANLYPIIQLKVLGLEHDATLFTGVANLAREGHLAIALLTFAASIAAPFLKLIILTVTLLGIRKPAERQRRGLPGLFRCYQKLNTWGMLEVYMLSLLIAFTKLGDLADVIAGIGLYSFAGLMLVSVFCSATLDEHEVWDRMETA